MKKIFSFTLLIAPFVFFACNEKVKSKAIYYPIDSVVLAQAQFLTNEKAVLTKHAEINGKEEISTFTPKDTTAWQHELDIFLDLKTINKPINRGNYIVDSGLKDSNSNLTIQSFTSTTSLPVVYLKIFYLDTPSKIKRIEALYREQNSLLKNSRLLILEFQELNNKPVLTSYTIEGGQKMFLGDSVQFSVKGTITLD